MNIRSLLRLAAGAIIVLTALANLWQFHLRISNLPPRALHEPILWEQRLIPIRDALLKAHYLRGDVGYVRPSTLEGRITTQADDVQWAHARYGMIPWNLLRHSLDAPYVLADFSGAEVPPDPPTGFARLYQSGDGLVVLQRTSR